jgi:hypothetical protein
MVESADRENTLDVVVLCGWLNRFIRDDHQTGFPCQKQEVSNRGR